MEQSDFLTIFLSSLLALYAVLALLWRYQASEQRLRDRGHSPEQAAFLAKDQRRRLGGMAVIVPLLELLAALIVYALSGPLRSGTQLLWIFGVFVVLVLPFAIRDRVVTQNSMKTLIYNSRERIAADFGFTLLHRVFRPFWEILFTAFAIVFALAIRPEFNLLFLHLAILWLLYLLVRGTRNSTRASLRDGYLLAILFMMVNHAVIAYHLVMLTICCVDERDTALTVFGIVLIAVLLLKSGVYLSNLPRLRMELRGQR